MGDSSLLTDDEDCETEFSSKNSPGGNEDVHLNNKNIHTMTDPTLITEDEDSEAEFSSKDSRGRSNDAHPGEKFVQHNNSSGFEGATGSPHNAGLFHRVYHQIFKKGQKVGPRRALHHYNFLMKLKEFCYTMLEEVSKVDNWKKPSVLITAPTLFVVLLAFLYSPHISSSPVAASSDNTVTHNLLLKSLRQQIFKKYPSHKRFLGDIFEAVSNVYNATKTKDFSTVITILYSHKETAECLANDAARYTAKMFHGSKEFAQINGSSIDENFTIGCDLFKNIIIQKGVLVIYNFHKTPAKQVKMFHGVCDKFTPYLNSKSVYIVLLKTSPNQENISNLMEKVDSRMNELWSKSLESVYLVPLVGRLSDYIIDVTQEKELFDC